MHLPRMPATDVAEEHGILESSTLHQHSHLSYGNRGHSVVFGQLEIFYHWALRWLLHVEEPVAQNCGRASMHMY